MIKLERIHVKNYKNIADADLHLGAVNVVVGENNAGKSNLLEVIPFLNYLINGPVNEVKVGFDGFASFGHFDLVGSDFSLLKPIMPLSIEIDFADEEKQLLYNYKILIKNSDSQKKENGLRLGPITIAHEMLMFKNKNHTGKAATIFHRNNNSVKYGDGIKKDAIINQIENHNSVMRLLFIIKNSENILPDYKSAITAMETILTSHIFYFSPHLLRERESKFENKSRIAYINLDSEISNLEKKPFWKDFKLVLKNMLNISEVELVWFSLIGKNHTEKIPLFKQNNREKLTSLLSDGTILLLALITKLFSDTSDIFLIEEPENSIHPRALSELMKLIRRFSLDKQFIITTHSPYLLNMVKPEEVFVAALDKKGRSTIGKLPDAKAIKKKLAKGFMDFGNIVFNEPATEGQGE